MQVPVPTEDALALFEDLVDALEPEVRRSQMMGRPTLMAGRKMVACLNGDVLGVRLGRESDPFAAALALDGAEVFQPGPGHRFRDWVGIPASSADAWLQYTVIAVEAVRE